MFGKAVFRLRAAGGFFRKTTPGTPRAVFRRRSQKKNARAREGESADRFEQEKRRGDVGRHQAAAGRRPGETGAVKDVGGAPADQSGANVLHGFKPSGFAPAGLVAENGRAGKPAAKAL